MRLQINLILEFFVEKIESYTFNFVKFILLGNLLILIANNVE